MLDALDAPAVRRWSILAADAMEINRAEIDELNVFPVPDGDTGTNLALTMRAAADALAADPASTAWAAVRAWPRGAVLGARGNSGVIVSQMLRGLAERRRRVGAMRRGRCSRSRSRSAADQACAAVADPVEGTILTVAGGGRRGRGRRRRCGRDGRHGRSESRRRPRPRCAARPSSCRHWPRPVSSTPAVADWSC